MFICQFCGKEFSKNFSLTRHERYYCNKNPNKQSIKFTTVYSNHKQAVCKYCGKSFDVACISKHETACGNPNSKLNLKKQQISLKHEGLTCIYCGKECKNKNSLAQHEIRCPQNPDRKAFNTLGNFSRQYFNGQTKETSNIISKVSNTLRYKYASGQLTCAMCGKPGT